MGLAFFGLTYETAPQIRVNLFTQIHEIIFHGNGGYTYEVIYNMPTWLRKFTFNQINNFYQQQKESMEKSQGGNTSPKVEKVSSSSGKRVNASEGLLNAVKSI